MNMQVYFIDMVILNSIIVSTISEKTSRLVKTVSGALYLKRREIWTDFLNLGHLWNVWHRFFFFFFYRNQILTLALSIIIFICLSVSLYVTFTGLMKLFECVDRVEFTDNAEELTRRLHEESLNSCWHLQYLVCTNVSIKCYYYVI